MSSRKESPRLTAGDVLARYNDGSWPDFCDTLTDVNQVGTFGNRPIHFACYHGNMEEIKALVEGGADVNVAGDMGSTPLHEAAEQGHIEAVRFRLEHGARTDLKREFGRTALDVAEIHGHSDIANLLEQLTSEEIIDDYQASQH